MRVSLWGSCATFTRNRLPGDVYSTSLPQLIFRALSLEPNTLSDLRLCRTSANGYLLGWGVCASECACACARVRVGEGANPKFFQGHTANQPAAGSAEHATLPYFSEYKQEAKNATLQPAPTSTPTPAPHAALILLLSRAQFTASLWNIAVCFGLTLHENLSTRGHGERELHLFKDDLFLTADL